MKSLFDRVKLGDLELANRIVMAPMTRARANDDGEPTDLIAAYYAQRASAGLIITEGVYPSSDGKGYFATPGIETETQTAAWRRVTDAVHARGGLIYMQMMHCGRVGHMLNKRGFDHVAPSAIQADFPMLTREEGMQRMSMPRALETEEVIGVLDRMERAAENAKAAGFDGVELHGASGYLPNQFLASNTNLRTDIYGGTPEKRGRLRWRLSNAWQKSSAPSVPPSNSLPASPITTSMTTRSRKPTICFCASLTAWASPICISRPRFPTKI